MSLCRILESPDLPKPLHVHDDPSYYTDILRHQALGFRLGNECLAPDLPFVPGDRPVSAPTIQV